MEISALVSDLQITHPAYDRDGIFDRQSLFEGGDLFEERKERFLRPRKADSNADYLKTRKAALVFSPKLGELFSTIAGACIRSYPHIESEHEFFKALNENATADGDDVTSLIYRLIVQSNVQKRAYLAVSFDGDEPRLELLDAASVDKWGVDEEGHSWYRTHTVESKVNLSGKPNPAVETWKYFTAKYTQTFTYTPGVNLTGGMPTATTTGPVAHEMGYAPIWPMRENCYLMGKMKPLFVAFLNRSCALSCLLDLQGFPVAILKTSNGNISTILLSEINGVKLEVGEDFSYASPGAEMPAAQRADMDAIGVELYSALQGFSGANIKDAQRVATGVVASNQVGLKGILLRNMGSARDCLNSALKCIADYKGIDVPKIDGLDDCDADSIDEKIARILGLKDVPTYPASSMAALTADLAKSLTPEVDAKTIDNESREMTENATDTGREGGIEGNAGGNGSAAAI